MKEMISQQKYFRYKTTNIIINVNSKHIHLNILNIILNKTIL